MASREHSLRGRIASEHHRREPDPGLIEALQRERAAVRIKDSIRSILAAAPPLTLTQRRHLAALVQDGGADAAA